MNFLIVSADPWSAVLADRLRQQNVIVQVEESSDGVTSPRFDLVIVDGGRDDWLEIARRAIRMGYRVILAANNHSQANEARSAFLFDAFLKSDAAGRWSIEQILSAGRSSITWRRGT